MLKTFAAVAPYLKFDPKRVIVDNFVFKLHYRGTFILLLVFTILVCSQQYFGAHIKCISYSIPDHVINTYCFFTPTFTLVRHLNKTLLNKNILFQPGIGPYETEDEPIKRHAYYQWVPFVLFLQCLCFYLPHMLWKSWEGGRIRALVYGMRMTGLTQYIKSQSCKLGRLELPSREEAESRITNIRRAMIDRMRLNQSWGAHLVFAEILNLVNLLAQIYFTNIFLAGNFYTLGIRAIKERLNNNIDTLDVVFPKVTKCHFQKFGPSGSLQLHDTLCVMALNIINEKIFIVLWFWYIAVLILTVMGLIWRMFTIIYYKSEAISRLIFFWVKPSRITRQELRTVVKKCNFSNWMFLLFLHENLSDFMFKRVIFHLASDMCDHKKENTLNANIDSIQTASSSGAAEKRQLLQEKQE